MIPLKRMISPKGILNSFIGTIGGSAAYQSWVTYRKRKTKKGRVIYERVRRKL